MHSLLPTEPEEILLEELCLKSVSGLMLHPLEPKENSLTSLPLSRTSLMKVSPIVKSIEKLEGMSSLTKLYLINASVDGKNICPANYVSKDWK